MSRNSKLTDEEGIAAVQEYIDGKGSYTAIAKKFRIHRECFRQMVAIAKINGIEAVKIRHGKMKYTTETKGLNKRP